MASEANGSAAPPPESELGEHRAFVREVHKKVASAYGFGGAGVLAFVAALLTAGWYWGVFASPILWLGAITAGLVGLFVVRTFVYRRADRLWDRVQSYCEANGVEPEVLREHFGDEQMYQFFDALFELQERRERMRRGELPDADEGA